MKRLFALIGIVVLLGMTLVGTFNLWLSHPKTSEFSSDNNIEKND